MKLTNCRGRTMCDHVSKCRHQTCDGVLHRENLYCYVAVCRSGQLRRPLREEREGGILIVAAACLEFVSRDNTLFRNYYMVT